MQAKEIAEIKASGRWPKKPLGFLNYFFLLIPIGFLFLGLELIKIGVNPTDVFFLGLGGLYTTIGLIAVILLPVRLVQQQKFVRYTVPGLKTDTVKKALEDNGFKNVAVYNVGYFWGRAKMWRFSFGEAITVIPDGDTILINSRPASNLSGRKPITIFRNGKKIKKLIEALHEAAQSDIFEG